MLAEARADTVAVPAGTRVKTQGGRYFNTLDYAEIPPGSTSVSYTHLAAAEHVNFAYANEEVLHDMSLTIPEKKIVGITGPVSYTHLGR